MSVQLPIRPQPTEHDDLGQVVAALKQATEPMLIGTDGTRVLLPHPLFEVLREAANQLLAGNAVSIAPIGSVLTTQQAADLLGVSRPFLTRLLTGGEIPFHQVGSHRRVYLEDVLEFKERHRGRRREHIRDVTRSTADMDPFATMDAEAGSA